MERLLLYICLFITVSCAEKQNLNSVFKPFKEHYFNLEDMDFFYNVNFLFIIDTSGSMPKINEILSNNIEKVLGPILYNHPYYNYNFAFTTMSPEFQFGKLLPGLFVDKKLTDFTCNNRVISESIKKNILSNSVRDVNIGSYLNYNYETNKLLSSEDLICLISHHIKEIKGNKGAEPFFDSLSYIIKQSDLKVKKNFFDSDSILILFFISDAFGTDDKEYSLRILNAGTKELESRLRSAEFFSKNKWDLLSATGVREGMVRSYALVLDYEKQEKCGGEPHSGPPYNYPFHLYSFIEKTGGLRASLCDAKWGDKLKEIYTDLNQMFVSQALYLSEVPRVSSIEVTLNGQPVPEDPDTGWIFNPKGPSIQIGPGYKPLLYPESDKEGGVFKNRFKVRYQPVNIEILQKERE